MSQVSFPDWDESLPVRLTEGILDDRADCQRRYLRQSLSIGVSTARARGTDTSCRRDLKFPS
jgi:hypothetical protein